MEAKSVSELIKHLGAVVQVDGDGVRVLDEAALPEKIDQLAYSAAFSQGVTRDVARWLIWEIGQAIGIYPSSIHELYMAVGRGDLPANFTTPAMNIRVMNYNTSRAVFRAANKYDVGAFIFEIARSEMGYTDQRPAEYVAAVMAAAIKEGFRGPLFIQGDHFQISASRYAADPAAEVQAVKDLIDEAVAAGFYNIDIDTSTLVDLTHPTLDEQQQINYSLCAQLTEYVRSVEPAGVTISLGGEIGEVGHKNSTVEELRAFMDGYRRSLPAGMAGISKISVQTGTSHGGVVLPDGTLADVTVDFGVLKQLSRAARDEYDCGGAVQHGASTLPATAFGKFPEIGTLEIHLATNFQNIAFDNLPAEVVQTAYAYMYEHFKKEWKAGQTEDQFVYQTRKKLIGPFKQAWWSLDSAIQEELGRVLQEQFELLFRQLNVMNTRRMAQRVTTRVIQHRPRPTSAVEESELEIAADLSD